MDRMTAVAAAISLLFLAGCTTIQEILRPDGSTTRTQNSPTIITGNVTLAWDASTSSNVGGYRVHYGLSSGIYPNKFFVGSQTSYTLSGLDSGKTYYIVVTAHEAIGFDESVFSNEVSGKIPIPDSDND